MANYGGYGRGMQQGYKRAGSPQFNTSSNKIRSYGNRDYGGHSHEQDMNFTSFDYGHQPAQHEEEDTTWRYCKLCNIQFSDKKHYVAHCGGLMHAQKQLMMENTSVPLRDDYNGGMQPRNDLRNEMRNSIPTHDDLPPRQSEMHECPLCHVTCSPASMESHFAGFRHCKAFLKQYAELGDSLFYQKFGNRIKFGMTIMDYPEPITPALRHIHWSGILNKFECRLCRAKCNTYPQWQQHCMSIPHAQTATELIGRMGREKFAIVYGDLPNNREQALNEYDDANSVTMGGRPSSSYSEDSRRSFGSQDKISEVRYPTLDYSDMRSDRPTKSSDSWPRHSSYSSAESSRPMDAPRENRQVQGRNSSNARVQDDYSSPKKSSSDYDKPWQQSSGGSVDKSWRPPNEELVKVEAMKKDVEEEWRKVEEERKEMKAEQEVLKAEMHTIKEEMIRIKEEMHRERKRREDIEAELTTEKKRRREMDDRLLGESRKKKEIEVQLDLEKKKGLSLRREKDEEKARVLDQLKKDNQRQIERLEGQIQRLERKRTQEDDKRQVRYEPRPERGHHHSAPHSAGSHMRGGYGHPRERYDRPESPQLTSHGESVPFGDSLQPFQPVQAPHQDLGTMQSSMGMEGASLEDIQVEQIRRMTGIQDGHKVRSALRVLRSMDPNMVSSLGSIDPASLRQISSKHPGFLQGLLNNLRQNISDNKFF